MANSYIAIATARGLHRLMPEDHCPAGRRPLVDSQRPMPLSFCFWAVLPDFAALSAWRLLDRGEPLEALRTVNHHAQQLGPISVGIVSNEPVLPDEFSPPAVTSRHRS
jgi:hypothetical protein